MTAHISEFAELSAHYRDFHTATGERGFEALLGKANDLVRDEVGSRGLDVMPAVDGDDACV